MSGPEKYSRIDFSPPDGVKSEAKKGLEWRQKFNRGGTEVGVARARDLSNGRDISPETARRMASYFARHAVDKKGQGWSPDQDGFPSAGRIAWALWGGDDGEAWSSKLTKQMDAADKPQARREMKEIRIDGVIGQGKDEVSAAAISSQLPSTGEPIRVSIHSEGGSVFEGFAIHDVLAKYDGPKTIAVESTAFSIASFIAMAGDEIEMSPNAYFMLHNPRISVEGDDEELGKTSGMIASLKSNMVNAYAQRTGKSVEEIQSILKAETYFNATEALAFGLADRVTQKPINGRPLACLATMPHGVVSALFGVGSGGDNDSKKGHKMTESTPVAATVQQIKAAYPKAKAEFVLSCIERALPMASVASAAAEEMMKENEELKARVSAMEEELAKAKAEITIDTEDEDEEEMPTKAKAMEDEQKKDYEAKARARGVKPVAKGTTGKPSASARWSSAVDDALAKCGNNKMKAVALASRQNPGLREAMLSEVNAR